MAVYSGDNPTVIDVKRHRRSKSALASSTKGMSHDHASMTNAFLRTFKHACRNSVLATLASEGDRQPLGIPKLLVLGAHSILIFEHFEWPSHHCLDNLHA